MEKRKLSDDTQEEPAKRRVIGPSLPPPGPESVATETSTADAAPDTAKAEGNGSDSDSDSDSDDDFGPSLPPPHGQSAPAPAPTYTTSSAPEQKPESQRDSWMLNPPEQSDWASKIDPTQLRNRKFQTGKSARSGGGGASKNLDASWVETPEEKLRRLEDAVMGVGAPSSGGSGGGNAQSSGKTNAEKDRAMEEKIKKYNDRSGKNTRLEKAEKKKKEEEDDPSTRAFDREKDMAVSSKISNAQRREMVNKASDYGSRFSKGSYL